MTSAHEDTEDNPGRAEQRLLMAMAAQEKAFEQSFPEEWERLGVALWASLFPRIEDILAKLEGDYMAIEPKSSLAIDDYYLGAWRKGSLHVMPLTVAGDCLRTTQQILQAGELPMAALYPMLRSTIESSSLALFLIAPAERDERLRRSFWVAADDADLRKKFADSIGNDALVNNEARMAVDAELRALVSKRPSLGPSNRFKFARTTYSAMVESADAEMRADPAHVARAKMPLIAWWQLSSGLSHGKQWSMITAFERSEAIVDPRDDSAHLKTTSSAAVVALLLEQAVAVTECALRRFGTRARSAWNLPEDSAEPQT